MAGADGYENAPRRPALWIERDAGQRRDREPESGAAERERERHEQVRDPRQHRQGDEAARQQRRASERSGTGVQAARKRAHGERCRRERAHHERPNHRVERPDGDHEQDGEE